MPNTASKVVFWEQQKREGAESPKKWQVNETSQFSHVYHKIKCVELAYSTRMSSWSTAVSPLNFFVSLKVSIMLVIDFLS